MRASVQTSDLGCANAAGAPNITGSVSCLGANNSGMWCETGYGALAGTSSYRSNQFESATSSGSPCHAISLDSSKSNSIYGSSNTIMPVSVNIPIIIYLGK